MHATVGFTGEGGEQPAPVALAAKLEQLFATIAAKDSPAALSTLMIMDVLISPE